MGSFYRSPHELVFVFKAGSAPYRNNVQLGRFGRNRTNVWDLAIRRWQQITGEQAIHALTGQSFEEALEERAAEQMQKVAHG